MGAFANSLFTALFGWIRSAAQWLWSHLLQPGESSALDWFGENWLKLVIVLCACCMVIDLVVYLLRWQPYKVWMSFLRRVTGKGNASEDSGRIRRQWIYADGSTEYDEVEVERGMEQHPEYPTSLLTPVPHTATLLPEKPVSEPQQEAEQPTRTLRRRRYIAEEEEMPLHYVLPPKVVNGTTYRPPYYPPQWRNPDHEHESIDSEGSGL